jgi:DNA-directed RNA polymerase subunit RPC12/RpoP
MCRYAMTSYKPHYACFNCRKTFKRRLLNDVARDKEDSLAATCPDCGQLMASMGLDFKSPPKKEINAWQHLQKLYSVGIAFHSCGCSGPGYIPRDSAELRNVLLKRKEEYVENLHFWLNKPILETKVALEKDRSNNLSTYNKVYHLQGKKGAVIAQEAVNHWTNLIQDIEHKLSKVLAKHS